MPLQNNKVAIVLLILCAVGQLAYSAEQTEPTNATLLPSFFTAIRNSDRAGMQQILKEQPEQIHARHEHGWTPLMLAAFYANADCVRLCIANGADVNAKNQFGASALHYAVSDLAKVRELLDAHADVNAATLLGNTPLILAARGNHAADIVRLLLDNRADPNVRNTKKETALDVASHSGNVESVKLILNHCTDADALRKSLDSALVWSTQGGHSEIAKLRLDAGADVNGVLFETPVLSYATAMHQRDITQLLLDGGARVDDVGIGFGGTPGDGGTPLVWAAENEDNDDAIVKLLLSHGADVNAAFGYHWGPQMNVSYTPLMVARRRGESDVVATLVNAGARDVPDPWNLERPQKQTPRYDHRRYSSLNEKRVAAAMSAIALLQHSSVESLKEFESHGRKQCISCHQQPLPLIAIDVGESKGVPLDRGLWEKLRRQIFERVESVAIDARNSEPTLDTGAEPSSRGYLSWAMSPNSAESAIFSVDASTHLITMLQLPDGSWPKVWPRPPLAGSQVKETALAIRKLTLDHLPSRQSEIDDRIQRARRWLSKTSPHNTQDYVFKLLGLLWAGEPRNNLTSIADALIGMQREDGGWAQLSGLSSDAYATGQVLYALQVGVGCTPNDAKIVKGLSFLIDDQCADGSWLVRRRAYPSQPTMDPKFPHGRDAWISAAGTSWAVMALTVGLDEHEVADVLARNKELATPKTYVEPKKTLTPAANVKIDYAEHILPILETSCLGCHSSDDPAGKYAMDSREALIQGGFSGPPVVIPGNSADSLLIHHVADQIEDVEMPPLAHRDDYDPLTAEQIGLLRAWIDQGLPGLEEAK